MNAKELVAVGAVGAGLAWLFQRLPVTQHPIIAGSAIYIVGYVVRGQRPASGWKMLEG